MNVLIEEKPEEVELSRTIQKKTSGSSSASKEKTIQIKTTEAIKYLIDLAVTESRVSITDFLLFGIVPALHVFVKSKKDSKADFLHTLSPLKYESITDWEDVEVALLQFRNKRKEVFEELETKVSKRFD
jgi:hypothetical protein